MRTGNCFEDAAKMVMSGERGYGNVLTLVHGLPTNSMIGVPYPHGWIEWTDDEGGEWVWDPCVDRVLNKVFYYHVGKIKDTVRYTRAELFDMLDEHGTYGWWDEMFEEAEENIVAMGY